MRTLALLPVAVLWMGCGASAEKVAGAAVTTGIAVAAAGVHRATTGGCYAACRHGFRCDEESGQCLPIPCGGSCPPNHECRMFGGELTCMPVAKELPIAPARGAGQGGGQAGGSGGAARTGDAQGGAGGQASTTGQDACWDLCFSDEQCVVTDDVADCVRR